MHISERLKRKEEGYRNCLKELTFFVGSLIIPKIGIAIYTYLWYNILKGTV